MIHAEWHKISDAIIRAQARQTRLDKPVASHVAVDLPEQQKHCWLIHTTVSVFAITKCKSMRHHQNATITSFPNCSSIKL